MKAKGKSAVERILQTMHPLVIYRPEDISAATGVDKGLCRQALDMLTKGGLVEATETGYRKQKVYQTKQKALPL